MNLDIEEIEYIRRVFDDLLFINKSVPVIVEGKRDRIALKRLGLKGRIIQLHRGQNIYEFCEDILKKYEKVILLIDWDKRGEQLYQKVTDLLKGHFEEYSIFRETLIRLFGKEIKEVEEIPKILREYGIFQ